MLEELPFCLLQKKDISGTDNKWTQNWAGLHSRNENVHHLEGQKFSWFGMKLDNLFKQRQNNGKYREDLIHSSE